MRKRRVSIAANPVLVGAVTTLVVVVAVFLAYNANNGLPFIPVFTIRADTENASKLVVGDDVREGGQRIGQVSDIDNVRLADGSIGAQLTLKIDKGVTPIPADTEFVIRPRSTLGLKYVDLLRGRSQRHLRDNEVITSDLVPAPELDDFFSIFDEPTRRHVQENLTIYGGAFSGRGADLNRGLAALPSLLLDLGRVSRTLSEPSTDLRGFLQAIARFTARTRPVAGSLARGLGHAADTFGALARDPKALRDTIGESPSALQAGIDTLPRDRPLLRALTAIGPDLTATAREIRAGGPDISGALAAGTRVLPDAVAFNTRLSGTLESLRKLAATPTTNLTLRGLQSSTATLNPTLRYIGPHITVCNYFNYFWTFISDHFAERVPSGSVERIEVKSAPLLQSNSMMSFGATAPANGGTIDPVQQATLGDAAALHAQPYGRAVDEQGNADCENGQRGYPTRLAEGAPANLNVAVDPRTPGDQGPTFTGLPRVPAGETFSAEPDGRAPQVVGRKAGG
jgi:ABC-type transporter Mla subunit MlaD